MNRLVSSAAMASFAYAQTDEEVQKFADFNQVVSQWGFTWEVFMVTTTDNKWELPLFHITGSTRDGLFPQSSGGESEFFPCLFQHGAYSDAIDWLGYFN